MNHETKPDCFTKSFRGNDFHATFKWGYETPNSPYFSFTGDCGGGSGAVGGTLAERHPQFKPLDDMHLVAVETGEPMHAWANANHFIDEKLFPLKEFAAESEESRHAYDWVN